METTNEERRSAVDKEGKRPRVNQPRHQGGKKPADKERRFEPRGHGREQVHGHHLRKSNRTFVHRPFPRRSSKVGETDCASKEEKKPEV